MKTSELKKVLETLIEKHGDQEIRIDVRDYFSKYGSYATIDVDTTGHIWHGIFCPTENEVRLDVHLEDNIDGKHPKITFRS